MRRVHDEVHSVAMIGVSGCLSWIVQGNSYLPMAIGSIIFAAMTAMTLITEIR